jgi:hypothetical protein
MHLEQKTNSLVNNYKKEWCLNSNRFLRKWRDDKEIKRRFRIFKIRKSVDKWDNKIAWELQI